MLVGDAGETWEPLEHGLPDRFYSVVVRDALSTDEEGGLYLGTRVGNVFASADDGDSWHEVVSNLPDVLVVRAAVL